MISKEQFEKLMVGDTVLTTHGDTGTVGGWNHGKTEVLLKFKGRPRFSAPWYRRHEIKSKIMPKIKFEDLDMETLKEESISIRNVKVGKDKSECDVIVDGKQVGDTHVFNEELKAEKMTKLIIADMIKKRDIILEGRKEMDVKLEEVEEKREGVEKEDTSSELTDAKHQEIEELAKSAKPMKFESAEERLEREGLVRGAIVARKDAFGNEKGYGILTGEFKKHNNDCIMEMTDGTAFNENYITLCTDVNKEIIRMLEAEKGRIRDKAYEFTALIDDKFAEIIFG